MATMTRLVASAEALAVLAARLRAHVEGIDLDPDIEAALDGILAELGVDVAALDDAERLGVGLMARSWLRQAVDLVENPGRPPGWGFDDPVILRSQGRSSATIAPAFAQVPELAEALDGDGAALLDVGAGVAGLSVAFCRQFPHVRVVGLEPWAVPREMALEAIAGLEDRIEIRDQRVEELDDDGVYDVAWVPGPFLSPAIVPTALERVRDALKPGGYIVFGLYASPPDPLAQRLVALRTIRGGGDPTTDASVLTAAGFRNARELERTWATPLRFILGVR
jgi:hypothetical protein